MQLDLKTVDWILSGESPYLKMYAQSDLPALELGDFRYCFDSALDRLVSNIGPLEYFWLGVEDLPPEHALKLKAVSTYHIGFPHLIGLHEDAARLLAADDWKLGNAPILEFTLRDPLSESAARALTESHSDGMFMSLDLPSITVNVARLLMAQLGELFLHVENEVLTPDMARVFSRHRGCSLTAWLDLGLVDETFRGMAIRKALSSNSGKKWGINRQRSRLVICDLDMDCDYFDPTEPN